MNYTTRMSRIHHLRFWLAGVLLAAVPVGPAEAQRPVEAGRAEARPVDLVITLKGCSPTSIFIAVDGDDKGSLLMDGKAAPQWTAHWDDTRVKKFPPTTFCASLRLGGFRTNCRMATPGEEAAVTAKFKFDCDDNQTRQVTVDARTAKGLSVSYGYVRTLAKPHKFVREDCDCLEKGDAEGTHSIRDVRLPDEGLRLQLFQEYADKTKVGLYIDEAFMERRGRKKGNTLSLNEDGVVFALTDQRARGKVSASNFSSIAIDLDYDFVKGKKLHKLDITVK